MENNFKTTKFGIFDGAKFGDKFLTSFGRIALYLTSYANNTSDVTIQGDGSYCRNIRNEDGYNESSREHIVSRYKEPIDEDKLDKVANKECPDKLSEKEQCCYIQGFIEGYYKANDE